MKTVEEGRRVLFEYSESVCGREPANRNWLSDTARRFQRRGRATTCGQRVRLDGAVRRRSGASIGVRVGRSSDGYGGGSAASWLATGVYV